MTDPIKGETNLTSGDILRVSLRLYVRYQVLFSGIVAIAVVLFSWGRPWSALADDARQIGPILLPVFILMLFMPHAVTMFHLMRRPATDRQVAYEIGTDTMTIRDGAGAAQSIPWSLVTRTKIRNDILFVKLRIGAWRVFLLRAFAPDERARLIERAATISSRK
ncbi:hypothetical protein [Aliihoeflea sp. PC F10.4]